MPSFLEVYDLASGKTRLVLATDRRIEAPNWHPDGWLLVNGDGRLFRVPPDAPDLHPLDTGFAVRCNNDHGFSPDGAQIILSSHTDRGSEIFIMPVSGGVPEPVTRNAPSWWHGWSPDGARIVYAAARGGRVVDIWSCPASGGLRTAADLWRRPQRRAGLCAGWHMGLLQLRPDRPRADLADAPGRNRP